MEKDTSTKKWKCLIAFYLNCFFLQMCIIYSPLILTFLSSWRSLVAVSMMETGGGELPMRRSKQQHALKNF